MSKPSKLPRWATDESNNDEPSEGQKDTGWTVDQIPPSDYFNWYQKNAYDWIKHYDEAAIQINPMSARIDNGGWKFDNGFYIQSVINGTQREKTFGPTIFRNISTADGTVAKNADGRPVYDAGATPGEVFAEIPLPVGSVVTAVTVYNQRPGDVGTITIKAYDSNPTADSTTQKGDTMTVNSGTSLVGTAITNFPTVTIASGHELLVQVTMTDTDNKLYGVKVTYVEPMISSDATLSQIATFSIPVLADMKVASLSMRVFGTATSDLTVWLTKVDDAEGEVALVAGTVESDIGAAWKTVTFTFTQDTVDVGDVLMLELSANEAGVRVGNMWLVAA